MENININVKIIKWKWAGHIARFKDERWKKLITEWQLSIKRGNEEDN